MPEDLKVDELREQLRSYGDWLERRSDVALSNVDGFVGEGGPDRLTTGADLDRSRPSGGSRLLAIAGVVVLIAGAAVLVFANRGEPSGSVTAADGEEPSTEAATTEADVDSGPDVDGPRSVLDVPAESDSADSRSDDGDTSDGNISEGSADSDADDQSEDGSALGDAADAIGAGGQNTGGQNSDGENTESETVVDGDSSTSSARSSTTTTTAPAVSSTAKTETTTIAPKPVGGSMTFLAPLNGDGVDINLGTTVRVAPVSGATSYTFIVAQNGAEAFRLTVDQPTFVLPGQLTAFTGGWKLEAGLMSMTVVATDASGDELADQTIGVVLRAGGDIPRRELPGQILPTIPSIPES